MAVPSLQASVYTSPLSLTHTALSAADMRIPMSTLSSEHFITLVCSLRADISSHLRKQTKETPALQYVHTLTGVHSSSHESRVAMNDILSLQGLPAIMKRM